MTDTGEQFTIVNRGDHFEVLNGFQPRERKKILFGLLDPGEWYAKQFIVPLQSQNIRNLVTVFADDIVDAEEQYRILSFAFRPLLDATLAMPVMRNDFLLKVLRLDTFWQRALLDPHGNETQQATVIYTHKQWLVIPGYHGKPGRRFVIRPEQLLELQKRIHQAEEADSLLGWLALARWYVKWREKNSEVP